MVTAMVLSGENILRLCSGIGAFVGCNLLLIVLVWVTDFISVAKKAIRKGKIEDKVFTVFLILYAVLFVEPMLIICAIWGAMVIFQA